MHAIRSQRHRVALPLALAAVLSLLVMLALLTQPVVAGEEGDAPTPEAAMPGVTELTEDNFDALVGKDKAALVEFYAPWCGHCKRLARDYALLGSVLDHATRAAAATTAAPPLLIGKVDVTQQAALADRFGVQSYPTLLFFAPASRRHGGAGASTTGTPEPYRGSRNVEDMVRYLDGKLAHGGKGSTLLAQLRALAPNEVQRAVELTSSNFAHVVGNTSTSTLVLFYAPWCAHCVAMRPVYNTLASIFANNDDVVIARLDATAAANAAVAAAYKIRAFPTLYMVPHGATARARVYRGSTTHLAALVDFVNAVTAVPRLVDGSVSVHYGTDAGLRQQLVQLRRRLGSGKDAATVVAAAAVPRIKDAAARLRDERVVQYYGYVADVLVSLAATAVDGEAGAAQRHEAVAAAWRAWSAKTLSQLQETASNAQPGATRDAAQIHINILQYLNDLS